MTIRAQASCTLSTIVDVEAVYTYYYLASSTITVDEAPKDNVNAPGASTITVVSGGQNYVWQLTEPTLNVVDDVIQTAVGQLYVIECVLFSNGTYDWGPLMTSSTYTAAKAAYNLSSQALSQAQAANEATSLLGGHFIYNSTWETTNTPHSANVVQTIINDVTNSPSTWGYNVHIGANGIKLRNNEITLSEWISNGLNFYKPPTNNVQGNLAMSLTSSALSFYGSSTSTADATLDSNGLKLVKGGIEAGTKRYELTSDTVINVNKTYFKFENNEYVAISDPVVNELGSYYEEYANNFIYAGTGISNIQYSVGGAAINTNEQWYYLAGDGFGVTSSGVLYSNAGYIGGIEINNYGLKSRNFNLDSIESGSFAIQTEDFSRKIGGTEVGSLRLAIGGNFGVNSDGILYTQNAMVSGTIIAKELITTSDIEDISTIKEIKRYLEQINYNLNNVQNAVDGGYNITIEDSKKNEAGIEVSSFTCDYILLKDYITEFNKSHLNNPLNTVTFTYNYRTVTEGSSYEEDTYYFNFSNGEYILDNNIEIGAVISNPNNVYIRHYNSNVVDCSFNDFNITFDKINYSSIASNDDPNNENIKDSEFSENIDNSSYFYKYVEQTLNNFICDKIDLIKIIEPYTETYQVLVQGNSPQLGYGEYYYDGTTLYIKSGLLPIDFSRFFNNGELKVEIEITCIKQEIGRTLTCTCSRVNSISNEVSEQFNNKISQEITPDIDDLKNAIQPLGSALFVGDEDITIIRPQSNGADFILLNADGLTMQFNDDDSNDYNNPNLFLGKTGDETGLFLREGNSVIAKITNESLVINKAELNADEGSYGQFGMGNFSWKLQKYGGTLHLSLIHIIN